MFSVVSLKILRQTLFCIDIIIINIVIVFIIVIFIIIIIIIFIIIIVVAQYECVNTIQRLPCFQPFTLD